MATSLLKRARDRIQDDVLGHSIGRFHNVRRAHSVFERQRQRLGIGSRELLQPGPATVFPDLDIEDCVAQLREEGLFVGLSLPEATMREIRDYASNTLCNGAAASRSFLAREVQNGRLPDGSIVGRGAVIESRACPAVHSLVRDPMLLEVARRHLGYRTKGPGSRLYWTFPSDLPMEERPGLACHYHYDTDGLGFLTIIFYLSDTDESNGAHVSMRRSHRKKPLKLLLTPTVRRSDREILDCFGADRETVISGPAGLGFMEDTSCYHKALAPRSAPRLALQISYR